MSRNFNPISVFLMFAVLVIAASSAAAQIPRVPDIADGEAAPLPTLGCCKCLGGTNALDLSTISSNHWTVNGNPVVFVTTVNPFWTMNPAPASWVSTVANTTTNVAGITYDYKLPFAVPRCTIEQRVSLSGSYAGDDDVFVYLDSPIPANLISQCTGGWCFNISHKPIPTFANYPVLPGSHTLIVRVKNAVGGASPSGMFINAKLSGTCAK
jgi:hypothetical protein